MQHYTTSRPPRRTETASDHVVRAVFEKEFMLCVCVRVCVCMYMCGRARVRARVRVRGRSRVCPRRASAPRRRSARGRRRAPATSSRAARAEIFCATR